MVNRRNLHKRKSLRKNQRRTLRKNQRRTLRKKGGVGMDDIFNDHLGRNKSSPRGRRSRRRSPGKSRYDPMDTHSPHSMNTDSMDTDSPKSVIELLEECQSNLNQCSQRRRR